MPATRTPLEITQAVVDFCSIIQKGKMPEFLKVTPEKWTDVNHCFYNVKEKCKANGGSIQYGWAIWEWPTVMLEAEFHAVWESPDRRLKDISARNDGVEKVLFLKDQDRKFVFSIEGYRVDNKRKPFSNHPIIIEFIQLAKTKFAIEEAATGSIKSIPSDQYLPIIKRMQLLQGMIYQGRHLGKIGRNSPCLCGSGKKFKKCCGG